MAICIMCLQDKQLIEAHLLPRCMYSADRALPMKIVVLFGSVPPKRSPTGLYDTNILCADCDNRIGQWDDHACGVLREDSREISIAQLNDGLAIGEDGEAVAMEVANASPSLLSKFVLSVVWRCHHSSRSEVNAFNLGPHAEKIRRILIEDADTVSTDYPVWLEHHEDLSLVMWVGRFHFSGVTVHVFMAQGFTFYVKTDQKPTPHPFELVSLAADRPTYAFNLQKKKTKFGREIIRGLQLNETTHGNLFGNRH